MASKRIKKKWQKQAQNAKLAKTGYTEKEIKKLPTSVREKELKRINKNERAQQLRSDRRARLLNEGIPLSIITRNRLDYKAVDFDNKKQLAEWRRKGQKLNAIRATGYRGKVTDAQLKKSWSNLQAEFAGIDIPEKMKSSRNTDIPLVGRSYLYVGVAEVKDGFLVPDLDMLSIDQIKTFCKEAVNDAKMLPDDSGTFSAAFQFATGTKSDMEYRAKVMYKRGYNMNPAHLKMDAGQYQKLTVSNKWSEREFFKMFYSCVTQMKNSDVVLFNNHLKRYCNSNNFPFMDDFQFINTK